MQHLLSCQHLRRLIAPSNEHDEWLSLVVVFRQVKYQKVFVIKLVSSEQDKNFAIMDWRCFPLNSKGIIISINTAIFTHT
ncbi:uncharacterized protein [Physcomitrium patens]|uniref:uncharacterized protein isoform X4 n=1 Tax=Physcomitrium patens TaxID=3218 RepID=UPI003CCD832E